MSPTFPSMLVLWRHLWNEGRGLEHLVHEPARADSVIVWIDEQGEPCRLAYQLEWDGAFATRRLWARVHRPDGTRTLELAGDGQGGWRLDGRPVAELEGCLDVDLWPTPFTNSLPIRRLRLRPGESAEIRAAMVVAPELSVSARAQRYTNLGQGRYRYEGLDTGFTTELITDEQALVMNYPGLFERLA